MCDYILLPEGSTLMSATDIVAYLYEHGVSKESINLLKNHQIDGLAFCMLTEKDLREIGVICVGQRKRILFASANYRSLVMKKSAHLPFSLFDTHVSNIPTEYQNGITQILATDRCSTFNPQGHRCKIAGDDFPESLRQSGRKPIKYVVETNPKPWKVLVSALYLFLVAGVTSFVMVLAHERLPNISKYPPLPDLFLDNLPYISWAFRAAEWVGVILGVVWITILIFHRYRCILLRRFFALSGTVFLLRSFTMIITSLSVPGQHLAEQCIPHAFPNNTARFNRFLEIWFGMGMSIRGIQTCGDYMFSGHTTMLTLLNFFITEYAPRSIQLIHTFSWVLNLFGVFFILASHEHYSIDVFAAIYVSSRLFLYYHCLANSRILHQEDKNRAMIWFPLFSFFEYDVCGIVPNEYELPFQSMWSQHRIKTLKKVQITSENHNISEESLNTATGALPDHLKIQ